MSLSSLSIGWKLFFEFVLYGLTCLLPIAFLGNPYVGAGYLAISTIIYAVLLMWIKRYWFGMAPLPGLSASDATDPASIVTQLSNIQNTAANATQLSQVITQLGVLKTTLNNSTQSAITAALAGIGSEITALKAGVGNGSNVVSSTTSKSILQNLGTLTGQVSTQAASQISSITATLNAGNADANQTIAALTTLQNYLEIDLASTSNPLSLSIDNMLSNLAAGVSLTPADEQNIQALLAGVASANNANNNIASAVAAVQSELDSTNTNTQTLLSNLGTLQSAVTDFSTSNNQQLGDISSNINTTLGSLGNITSIDTATTNNVNTILSNVNNLGTTTDTISSLVNTIQQQMGTDSTTTGSLIDNLTALQGALTALATAQGTSNTATANSLVSVVGSLKTTIDSLNSISSLDKATQQTVNGLVTSVGNLGTTTNAISSLVSTIQSQMGTNSTSTGSLISNLSALQTAVTGLQTSVNNNYNNLNSSINAVSGSVAALNTIDTATKGSVGTLLTNVTALAGTDQTIGNNVAAIQTLLGSPTTAGSLSANVGTLITNLGNLQTSVTNSANANNSAFNDPTNGINAKITAINTSLASGVSLNSTTSATINNALSSIQTAVVKTYTAATLIQAISQLKQSLSTLGYAETLALPQLAAIDAVGDTQAGLTLIFDESTSGKNIGVATGRVYQDASGNFYHIDTYGNVSSAGTTTTPAISTYKVYNTGATGYMYIANPTTIYTSADGMAFTQVNTTTGGAGTNTMLYMNGTIVNNSTSKPGVIASTPTLTTGTIFYYSYNGTLYTSTDYVKFTQLSGGSNVIYYMESGTIAPSSVVTTDSSGILWAQTGLMSVQVYSPGVFTISYNSSNYTLYNSTTAVMMSNGIYTNGSGKYVYQYNNNWYTSTDGITFNQITFDSTGTIATGVNTSSTIYSFNNQVQTSAPATVVTNSKTYMKFGILYVNPTNLADTYVFCLNTVFTKQPFGTYGGANGNASYDTPIFVSSGSPFGSGNTIVYTPVLGVFTLSAATGGKIINADGTVSATTSGYPTIANGTYYSSKSGYFNQEGKFYGSSTYIPNHSFTNGTYTFSFSSGNMATICNASSTINYSFSVSAWSVKATGKGTFQYLLVSNKIVRRATGNQVSAS